MNYESEEYQITVRDVRYHRGSTYRHRWRLKTYGLVYENGNWTVCCPVERTKKVRKLKRYCERNGMTCTVKNTKYRRSSTYRKEYLRVHKPDLCGRYFCIYCGKLLKEKSLEVDHILPVYAAETNPKIQKKLKRYGWETPNDIRNLGASCSRCNRIKSSKLGIWVVRGRIGQKLAFQYFRLVVLLLCLTAFVIGITRYLGT